MMKRTVEFFRTALVALFVFSAVSCAEISNYEPVGNAGNFQIEVADYPSYQAVTKAVGIEDAGKTAWTEGDRILLAAGENHYVLSFDGNIWISDKNVVETGTVAVKAYYAPDYEWGSTADPVLKSDCTAGLDEYLVYSENHDMNTGLTINFKGCRDYSRIRVVALAGETVELSGTFMCNAQKQEITSPLSVMADANGNAFFFGTWVKEAELTFKVGGLDIKKIMPMESVAGKGFVTYTAGFEYDASKNLFTIKDARALKLYANLVNSGSCALNGSLACDIDLSEICGPEKGNWIPIGQTSPYFSGTFDGRGMTVSNLYIESTTSKLGLFSVATDQSVIKNVKVSGNIKGAANLGGLVGIARGRLENCEFSGSVSGTGNYIGGLAGYNDNVKTDIEGCINHATVSGVSYVGGIAGCIFSGRIENCQNSGKVEASKEYAAGIVGYMQKAAKGTALVNRGIVYSPSLAGGICGYFYGKETTLAYCINLGKSSGGGLCGKFNAWPTMVASYSTGTSKYGLSPNAWNSTLNAVYWTGAGSAIGGGNLNLSDTFEVNGTTVQWNSGSGSANAMEYMNAQLPAVGWKFVPNDGADAEIQPLVLSRR